MKTSSSFIPASKAPLSLVWQGDTLVDWVSGGCIFQLDGRFEDSRFYWPFPFDAAQTTADGECVVVYQRAGTKGVLLKNGGQLREINRSYYHATTYEYPISIWRDREGRALLAHCPEKYNQIEIEDFETGERLTNGKRKPADLFHSRLQVNRDGTYLLSAGWIWHPLDFVAYYEIERALQDASYLDAPQNSAPGSRNVGLAEESSACWQTNSRVLLGGGSEEEDREEVQEAGELRLCPRGIAVYDVLRRKYLKSTVLSQGEIAGTMMPVGEDHVVSFYKHPKLISLESGEVIQRWEDLDTGTQTSSIIQSKFPPLALDPANQRFAIAGRDGITIIQISS